MKRRLSGVISNSVIIKAVLPLIVLLFVSFHKADDAILTADIEAGNEVEELFDFPFLINQTNPDFSVFDQSVEKFMRRWDIKGASIALAKDGKIVYNKGYGYANAEQRIKVTPNHKFRMASISKLITATAIMKLVEDGKLSIHQKVFGEDGILNEFSDYTDPLYSEITVKHLLTHRAGWSSWEFDPMFSPEWIAKKMNVPSPADDKVVIDYVLKHRKLRYRVGTKYAYSNVGYVILGKVIEKVSDMAYEDYVASKLLVPIGINDIKLGRSQIQDRDPWETAYYNHQGAPKVSSIFEPEVRVAKPDGGNNIEALNAAGGWIATSASLLRFILSIDGEDSNKNILSSESIAQMTERGSWSHAFGWSGAHKGNFWRSGTLAGTSAYTMKAANGYTWVVLLNSSVWNGHRFTKNIRYMMQDAIKKVENWPEDDLRYYYPMRNDLLPLASF